LKDKHNGKMVADWAKAVEESTEKPELVDMAQAVSTFMAVKDEEELVIILHCDLYHTDGFVPERHKDCWKSHQNFTATPHSTEARDHSRPGSENHTRSICQSD
jgi:hypothetical protein